MPSMSIWQAILIFIYATNTSQKEALFNWYNLLIDKTVYIQSLMTFVYPMRARRNPQFQLLKPQFYQPCHRRTEAISRDF